MKKFSLWLVVLLVCLTGVTSCSNTERHVQLFADSNLHSGRLRGYATVFEMVEYGEVAESETTYPVYEYDDGTFSIEFDGDSYGLKELSEPISPYGDNIFLLRYKMDSRHYVEKIPTSY